MPYPGASLTIGAVQPALRSASTSPLESARHCARLMRDAAAANAVVKTEHEAEGETEGGKPGNIDLFVLPELCPIGYSESTFDEYLAGAVDSSVLDDINRDIEKVMSETAQETGAYVCYGAIGTKDDGGDGGKREWTIRQIVLDDKGTRVAHYDKIHLCDYGDCAETRYFVPGSETVSFKCCGLRVGVIICADMRNPSLSRELAGRHGADVILQPAAFSRDVSFRTWRSFRETRAVENSVYFVGVNYAGEYYGDTTLVEPWVDEHHEPTSLGMGEGVLVGTLQGNVLDTIRKSFPYYQQLQREGWK